MLFEILLGVLVGPALLGFVADTEVTSALADLGLGAVLLITGMSGGLLIGLALTTRALGMILPIVRDSRAGDTPFGNRVLAAGTIGEFGPILAIAFVLSGPCARSSCSWRSRHLRSASPPSRCTVGIWRPNSGGPLPHSLRRRFL